MIICHRHKFIFLKTKKTAGTSLEIALSQFCGPEDTITPIPSNDEAIRTELGFRGPQNWKTSDWSRWLRKQRDFDNHSTAKYIRDRIGAKKWSEYYKFTIERNPYDKAISRYFWSTRDLPTRPSISDYLKMESPRKLSNWGIYTINGTLAVDYVIRYEQLAKELPKVLRRLNLTDSIQLPRAKGKHRVEKKHYSMILDTSARERIEQVCANELKEFNYKWESE
jgi:hypothetical protein